MAKVVKKVKIYNMINGLVKAKEDMETWKNIIYASDFWRAFEGSISKGVFTPTPRIDNVTCLFSFVRIEKMWAVLSSETIGANILIMYREPTYQYDQVQVDIKQTIDIDVKLLNEFDAEQFAAWEAKHRNANIRNRLTGIKEDIKGLVKQFDLSKDDIASFLFT